MSDQTVHVVKVAAAELGGPGAPDAARCSARAIAALSAAAGPGMRLASVALDVASHLMEEAEVEIAVTIDKRAKSIVFASAEAKCGGKPVFSAQGLFSRSG